MHVYTSVVIYLECIHVWSSNAVPCIPKLSFPGLCKLLYRLNIILWEDIHKCYRLNAHNYQMSSTLLISCYTHILLLYACASTYTGTPLRNVKCGMHVFGCVFPPLCVHNNNLWGCTQRTSVHSTSTSASLSSRRNLTFSTSWF